MRLSDATRTIAKVAVASGLAWWFASLAGQSRPVFAAMAPVVVIRMDPGSTLRGSFGRVLGVIAGVGIGLVALSIARPSPLEAGIVVAAALVVDNLIGLIPKYGVDTKNQSAISALILLFVATRVNSYAVARIWETALGAAVGLVIEILDSRIEPKLPSADFRFRRRAASEGSTS